MKLKSLGYVLLFLGLLTTELIKDAEAVTKNERDLCVAFGDAAYQIALNRDNAINVFESRRRVIGAFDDRIRDAILIIVDMVYEKPWHAPATEAQLIIAECIKQIEKRVTL